MSHPQSGAALAPTTDHRNTVARTRSPLEHAIALLATSIVAAKAMPTLEVKERRDAVRMVGGAQALAIEELQRALDDDPNLQALAARVERRARCGGGRRDFAAVRRRAVTLQAAGFSFSAIATLLGEPIGSVKTWCRVARLAAAAGGAS